jgi:hypothetical protein
MVGMECIMELKRSSTAPKLDALRLTIPFAITPRYSTPPAAVTAYSHTPGAAVTGDMPVKFTLPRNIPSVQVRMHAFSPSHQA